MIAAEDVVEDIPDGQRGLHSAAEPETPKNPATMERKEKAIYLPAFCYAEVRAANRLTALSSHPASVCL